MRKTGLAFAISIALFAAVLAWLMPGWRAPKPAAVVPRESILLYCAADLKVPMEEIAREYRKVDGIGIQFQFGESQALLTRAEASHRGDLFLSADDSYVELARQRGLIADSFPLTTMRPVLAVKQGNPKNIHSLDDLYQEGIQIAQANPDVSAIGKITKPLLENAGAWDRLKQHTRMRLTAIDVANAVKVGSVDAGIVWNTTVRQVNGLEAVDLPAFAGVRARINAGILKSSKHPLPATNFAKYLAAQNSLKVFERYGYHVTDGQSVGK